MDAIRAAKLFVVPATFFLTGYATQASQGALPSLFDNPAAVSTSSFADIFYRGANVIVPGVALTSVATGYLTYALPAERALWAISTGLVLAPLAFTQLFMMAGIQRLLHLKENAAECEKSENSGEVRRLLETWTAQNWVRAAMYAASGAVGIWASIA